MSGTESTPEPKRTLLSKTLVTESNYSPRTLQNTRTRFAGLFTAFGVSSETAGARRPFEGSEEAGNVLKDVASSSTSAGKLPLRLPTPTFQPLVADPTGTETPACPLESGSLPLSETLSDGAARDLSGPSTPMKVWSFLLPTPAHTTRRLSPASSMRQRLRGRNKGKEKMGAEDEEEWDEACFVDLEQEMEQMGVVDRKAEEPKLVLPLPDELILQVVEALPASLAVYKTLSMTCKSLARLVETQTFWKLRLSEVDYKQLYKTRLGVCRQWLYDAETGLEADEPAMQRMKLQSHTDSIYAAQASERWLVTGARDWTIKLWRLPALNTIWTPHDEETALVTTVKQAHTGSVLCLQFEERSQTSEETSEALIGRASRKLGFLVTGSSDFTIGIWSIDWEASVPEIVRTQTLRGHSKAVLDVILTRQAIISASKDSTVKVWSRDSLECLHTLSEHSGPVNALTVNHFETQLASVSGDGRLIIWDLATGQLIKTLAGGGRGLACGRWSGNYLLVGSNEQDLKLYHPGTGELVRTFEGHTDLVRTVALDIDIGVAVSGSYDNSIRIWNLRTGALLRAVPAHDSLVFGVRIDKTRLISFSRNTVVIQQLGVGLPHLELCC